MLVLFILCKLTDAVEDILIPCSDLIWAGSCSDGWTHTGIVASRLPVESVVVSITEFISKVLTLFRVNICCLYSAEITTLSSPLWWRRLHFRVHYDKARWGMFDWLNAQPLRRVIAPVQQSRARGNLRSSLSSLKGLLLRDSLSQTQKLQSESCDGKLEKHMQADFGI